MEVEHVNCKDGDVLILMGQHFLLKNKHVICLESNQSKFPSGKITHVNDEKCVFTNNQIGYINVKFGDKIRVGSTITKVERIIRQPTIKLVG